MPLSRVCANSACNTCDMAEDAACQDYALSDGICNMAPVPSAACNMLFTDMAKVKAAQTACFGTVLTFDGAFPVLAKKFCGAP
jgi:hypothetical protein